MRAIDSPGGNFSLGRGVEGGEQCPLNLISPFDEDIDKYSAQDRGMKIFTMSIKLCTQAHKVNTNKSKEKCKRDKIQSGSTIYTYVHSSK